MSVEQEKEKSREHRELVNVVSDSKLVKKAKIGDFKAYEKLVKRYEGKLYALIYKIVENKEDAKDILQDTFISAFRGLNTFQEKSSFSTWLYRVATNNALMKLRKHKQARLIAETVIPLSGEPAWRDSDEKTDWSSDISISIYKEELRKVMDSAIFSLPVMYKTVFILRDIDGLSTEETAKVLALSIGAVKSRLHRARLHLREEISKYFSARGKQIMLRGPTSILPYKDATSG